MSKPIAVLISDVHYSIPTLELADAAMRLAIAKGNELGVSVIVAGDLHDTKANLRGECVNAMIKTFKTAKHKAIVIRGNHCSINEKSIEHSLSFLDPYCHVIAEYQWIKPLHFIAYQHTPELFKQKLSNVPKNSTIIMHQGVHGSASGEYIQDKSAIPKEWLADYRVISGHYHTRQDIKCGRPQKGAVGLMSYIGNPYTLNFGEASDPEKGFQILNDDGTLTFVPTKLRRHVVLNIDKTQVTGKVPLEDIRDIDLVKVKYTGTKEELNALNKDKLGKELGLKDFKLELIPLDTKTEVKAIDKTTNVNNTLDTIINNTPNVSNEQKERLKQMWRDYADN